MCVLTDKDSCSLVTEPPTLLLPRLLKFKYLSLFHFSHSLSLLSFSLPLSISLYPTMLNHFVSLLTKSLAVKLKNPQPFCLGRSLKSFTATCLLIPSFLLSSVLSLPLSSSLSLPISNRLSPPSLHISFQHD